MSDREGMTARETAEELGVVERTIRRWIASGDLRAEKVGGQFRIDLDEARRVHASSRSGRSVARFSELAELRGRYTEVCERLEAAEQALIEERIRRIRAEAILWPPAAQASGGRGS